MLKNRFRKNLPVVVDIETGGFDPEINAILEIAITLIEENDNKFVVGETYRHHITLNIHFIAKKLIMNFYDKDSRKSQFLHKTPSSNY